MYFRRDDEMGSGSLLSTEPRKRKLTEAERKAKRSSRAVRFGGDKPMSQKKQMRLELERQALLEQAELQNEIAIRSRIARFGGRRSLLSAGETGFSGSLLV